MRLIIGDERAHELSTEAFRFLHHKSYSTEELVYLSECFDYLAWLHSEGEIDRALSEGAHDL